MLVLGISAFYHDSAAALVRNGSVIAAAQEERFSRKKNDAGFPTNAIRYVLDEGKVAVGDLDYIGFYDKPILTFDRLLETYFAFAPAGLTSFARAMPIWAKDKLFHKRNLVRSLNGTDRGEVDPERIVFGYHHHSHAASAFYPSPFLSAAILVMDGVGEWATTTWGRGHDEDIELIREIKFPHSLGLLYSAFTYYLGFKVNDGEYKVMGLAPYGEPKYVQAIYDHLIDLKADGSFNLNMKYFNYCTGLTMTNGLFDGLFGGMPPRVGEAPLTQAHMDVARSVQVVTEEAISRSCRALQKETGESNLTMAGGVALNCVANGRLLREGMFKKMWIQPAAGDAGGAVGVALSVAHLNGVKRQSLDGMRDGMQGAYLGPAFTGRQIGAMLTGLGSVSHEVEREDLIDQVASALANGKVVGWFQGRMEFGPRALGNRSILADPRSVTMQRLLNLKIKYRESFRPFAPAVLREQVADYFEMDQDSPYMLLVADVQRHHRLEVSEAENALSGLAKLRVLRSDLPAVTHVDFSARVQTVHQDTNPLFFVLLERFRDRTGCGVLVNTSFNVRDEPIVCTPLDAYKCFMATEMDVLAMENFMLFKDEQ